MRQISFRDLRRLFSFGAIAPVLSVFCCWIFYYSLGHHTKNRIVTISETVLDLPESRIFGISMNVEAWILLALFAIRNLMISDAAKSAKISKASYKALISLLWATSIVIPVGLSVLSAITLRDNKKLHLTGAGFFFFGFIIQNFINDATLKFVGFKISRASFACTVLCAMFILCGVLIGSQQRSPMVRSIGSLIQYSIALTIFTKIGLTGKDLEHNRKED